jgi:hypothetical protein
MYTKGAPRGTSPSGANSSSLVQQGVWVGVCTGLAIRWRAREITRIRDRAGPPSPHSSGPARAARGDSTGRRDAEGAKAQNVDLWPFDRCRLHASVCNRPLLMFQMHRVHRGLHTGLRGSRLSVGGREVGVPLPI